MTIPRGSIRGAVKERLRQLIQDNAGEVEVFTDDPGDTLPPEAIVMVRTTGTVTMPVTNAGRRYRDDNFTITLIVQAAKNGQTPAEAVARAEELLSFVEDAVADDPGLGGVDGLMKALQGTTEGPDHYLGERGSLAYFTVEIDCEGRYY